MPNLRVLLAGCNETIAEPLRIVLAHHGHQVSLAQDWQDALRMVAAQPPDVVLIEERLPLFDGLKLAKSLLPGPFRVILVTNSIAVGRKDAALEVGCTLCLRRPFEMHALVEAIEGRTPRAGAVVLCDRSPSVVIETADERR